MLSAVPQISQVCSPSISRKDVARSEKSGFCVSWTNRKQVSKIVLGLLSVSY